MANNKRYELREILAGHKRASDLTGGNWLTWWIEDGLYILQSNPETKLTADEFTEFKNKQTAINHKIIEFKRYNSNEKGE